MFAAGHRLCARIFVNDDGSAAGAASVHRIGRSIVERVVRALAVVEAKVLCQTE